MCEELRRVAEARRGTEENGRVWPSIEEDLLRLIRAGSFGEIPRERLDTIEDLIVHVEYGVALELLCSNLDDFEVEVDETWALALEMAVDRLGLDPHYRALVRNLKRL
jgi:hypothetical protein